LSVLATAHVVVELISNRLLVDRNCVLALLV